MQDVLAFASKNSESGKKVALVTVIGIGGSSPATPGQMIAVLADGRAVGTVGGGASEHRIINRAIEAINSGESVFTVKIDHAENDMICGGNMEVFGTIIGNNLGLCIFGGGHIAQNLARMAVGVGFFVTIVEDRPEFATDFESVKYTVCKPDEYKTIDPVAFSDYAVICTRGHSFDAQALDYCLTKNLKYIGMIGSKKKVSSLYDNLENSGISKGKLGDVYAPIGLDIADAAPGEIAVAILAELLLVKNNGKLRHKKDDMV
ncbi:MAG: XdhC family protein [Oscillospiraceae bacterium]|jgi:xanthine dehydrogenase accessory factor|nr:XdhC family protein [Oscillospiraceae bacterium]